MRSSLERRRRSNVTAWRNSKRGLIRNLPPAPMTAEQMQAQQQQAAASAQQAQGTRVRGATRGTYGGAAIGAIAGDAGKRALEEQQRRTLMKCIGKAAPGVVVHCQQSVQLPDQLAEPLRVCSS